MKKLTPLVAFLFPVLLAAAESGKISVTVSDIPAGTTEVIAVFDVVTPPQPADYDPDAAAAAAPAIPKIALPAAPAVAATAPATPAAAPVAKADPAAAPAPAADQPRRRRGGRGGPAAPTFQALRQVQQVAGSTTATFEAGVPAGPNYQVRVVALRGGGLSPIVVAGDRQNALTVVAEKSTPVSLALKSPTLKLAATNPATVAPGATYTLAGVIADAAGSLGTKSRMRVWITEGAPPRENYTGRQTSTVDVKLEGNEVSFSFALKAPAKPTTLYYQFGEIPDDFARPDGTQAGFLVSPNLAGGEAPLTLRVQ